MKVVKTANDPNYRKNRDKILKLITIVGQQFQIPPEFQGTFDWKTVEETVKEEMAQNKEVLPEVIEYCKWRLSQVGQDGYYGYYETIDCVNFIATKMKIHATKVGAMVGFLEAELGQEKYWYILPPLLAKVVEELSKD